MEPGAMNAMIDWTAIIIGNLASALLLMFVMAVRLAVLVRRLRQAHRCRECGSSMLIEMYCPRCSKYA